MQGPQDGLKKTPYDRNKKEAYKNNRSSQMSDYLNANLNDDKPY